MVAAFSLIMGSILLLLVVNNAYAQYSGQPGAATLEEQLKLATEKINNAQAGAYDSATANSQPNEWKTFEDLTTGISFVYPSDYFLINTTNSAGLISMYSGIGFNLMHIPLKNTSLIKTFTDSVNMPMVTQFDFETLKNIGINHINTLLKNNSNSLLIENVTTDKWKVDGNNAISYIMSVKLSPASDYMRTENILFSNDKSDMYYGASFTAPSLQFETLETRALEKRFIDSIKISK